MNKKILVILVLVLTFALSTKAVLATLTLGATSLTGSDALTVIGGSSASQDLTLSSTSNATKGKILFGTSAYDEVNNRLGIGTVTPNQQIEITGSFRIPTTTSTTTGVIYKDGDSFIHNFNLAGTGGYNTFVGINAGNFTMTGSTGDLGSYNTAVGDYALNANTTGHANTANGLQTLYANTTGFNNTAIGTVSLTSNTTGNDNTAIGVDSLSHNTTGNYNTGNGLQSLFKNTTGYYNTAIGANSLYSNTTSSNNMAIGYNAGYLTTGSNNIFLGYQAGNNLTTGSNNIVLGYDIDTPTATSANTMTIGNLIFATGLDATGTSIATGKIGVGVIAPAQKLEVNGGIRINTATAKPTCDATARGTFWAVQSSAGVKDTVEVCAKDVADSYAWRTLY